MDDLTMPGSKVPYAAVDEAVRAARRVLSLEYPDEQYLPLVLVLPIHRDLLRQARGGDTATDAAIRRSLCAVVESVRWPDA